MREILDVEEEEESERKKRKKERKKEGEKAEGIILLICLDPVKLQIALNQCFMAVLQISFIYTLYMARQEGTTFRFRKSRVLFLSPGDKELTPVTKNIFVNVCKKRHVLAFENHFIPSAWSNGN